MEKKITVKGINKTNEKEKAVIHYLEEGSEELHKSVRTIYYKKNFNVVVFKGVQYLVKFNNLGFSEDIKVRGVDNATQAASEEIKVENKVKVEQDGIIKHHKFNEIKVCVDNDVPVYLYGPAGSGKNHVLQQIAEELGLDFYFTNSVQQEFKITGFIDAGGTYQETEFFRAFTKGGLFFLDELDASIPEVLVLLNAALANRYFDFPQYGKVDAHPDFRVVSAGNTVGTGADEQYTGRLQLDQATLDRFAMIEFDYDKKIELAIAKGNEELVSFIRSLRKQALDKGIAATFSYRCISVVTKLEGKLDLKEVLKIAVIKGLDKDTVRTFQTTASNKYSKALWMMNQAG